MTQPNHHPTLCRSRRRRSVRQAARRRGSRATAMRRGGRPLAAQSARQRWLIRCRGMARTATQRTMPRRVMSRTATANTSSQRATPTRTGRAPRITMVRGATSAQHRPGSTNGAPAAIERPRAQGPMDGGTATVVRRITARPAVHHPFTGTEMHIPPTGTAMRIPTTDAVVLTTAASMAVLISTASTPVRLRRTPRVPGAAPASHAGGAIGFAETDVERAVPAHPGEQPDMHGQRIAHVRQQLAEDRAYATGRITEFRSAQHQRIAALHQLRPGIDQALDTSERQAAAQVAQTSRVRTARTRPSRSSRRERRALRSTRWASRD